MADDLHISVKDAVYKLQLHLLDGVQQEKQLLPAGSILCRSDYEDVVIERSISNVCGYPLCHSPLPSDRPQRGRYRISLKTHTVYDLHETRMFCSSNCLINSRAFAGSLSSERSSDLNFKSISEVLRLFKGLSMEKDQNCEKKSEHEEMSLKIGENEDARSGDVSEGDWVGPANAIEGYTLQLESQFLRKLGIGTEPKKLEPKIDEESVTDVAAFSNTTLGDITHYRFRKDNKNALSNVKCSGATEIQIDVSKKSSTCPKICSVTNSKNFDREWFARDNDDHNKGHLGDVSHHAFANYTDLIGQMNQVRLKSSVKPLGAEVGHRMISQFECSAKLSAVTITEDDARASATVSWADERTSEILSDEVCNFQRADSQLNLDVTLVSAAENDKDAAGHLESAECYAHPSSQAAQVATSDESGTTNAVSEGGSIILLQHFDANPEAEDFTKENQSDGLELPKMLMNLDADVVLPEKFWQDSPPEGFSLTLSPFAKIWMSVFEWITSSSLAYIYGRSGSDDEFTCINGREYPHKTVIAEGHSLEIKQALAVCVSQIVRDLVTELKVSIPISSLEKAVGCLLDTMSFTTALPPLKRAQWQVIVLLFFDALSVCRIPALYQHMASMHWRQQKILEAAQVSIEEYYIMKDLYIPLGQAPVSVAENGG